MVVAAKTKAGFHRALHRELDAMLMLTRPRCSVTLALDGPAPLAKLLTQRSEPAAPEMHTPFSWCQVLLVHKLD